MTKQLENLGVPFLAELAQANKSPYKPRHWVEARSRRCRARPLFVPAPHAGE
jgi:hypothetical protein